MTHQPFTLPDPPGPPETHPTWPFISYITSSHPSILGDHLATTWWPIGDQLWPIGDHLATIASLYENFYDNYYAVYYYNYYADYYNDYCDDYYDDYDNYGVLNLIQLLMLNSHSLLRSSCIIYVWSSLIPIRDPDLVLQGKELFVTPSWLTNMMIWIW